MHLNAFAFWWQLYKAAIHLPVYVSSRWRDCSTETLYPHAESCPRHSKVFHYCQLFTNHPEYIECQSPQRFSKFPLTLPEQLVITSWSLPPLPIVILTFLWIILRPTSRLSCLFDLFYNYSGCCCWPSSRLTCKWWSTLAATSLIVLPSPGKYWRYLAAFEKDHQKYTDRSK